MKTYLVGGAVRDQLLGLPVRDRDYVVVGTTPQEMIARSFQPVGKDFPVFLHPETHEEYALARTERKTAPGYKGFQIFASPAVTLEEDLGRRDLTINAMAIDETGQLVDPYHGADDLSRGILRHVSIAFSEDPVRILRVSRFAARFIDFSVAPETLSLMRAMVDSGEIDSLVSERVWQELARGLMEAKPSRMFEVLRSCGTLEKVLPEINSLFDVPNPAQNELAMTMGTHVMRAVDYAATQGYSLAVRFAALTHDLGKGSASAKESPNLTSDKQRSVLLLDQLSERIRVPTDCQEQARLAARFHSDIHHCFELTPDAIVEILQGADGFRRPERFNELLLTCEVISHGGLSHHDMPYPQAEYLRGALRVAASINAAEIAARELDPNAIGKSIKAARVFAVSEYLKSIGAAKA